jgi:hypothetical protein
MFLLSSLHLYLYLSSHTSSSAISIYCCTRAFVIMRREDERGWGGVGWE